MDLYSDEYNRLVLLRNKGMHPCRLINCGICDVLHSFSYNGVTVLDYEQELKNRAYAIWQQRCENGDNPHDGSKAIDDWKKAEEQLQREYGNPYPATYYW